MSRIGDWVRRDLRRVNKPSEVVRTVRAFPMIMVRAALDFVLALLLIYAVLAIFRHSDAFGEWWWLAALWAGLSAGSLVSQHKAAVRHRSRRD